MLFLAELDHIKSGQLLTTEAGRTFIDQIIFPTLARAEQLVKERKILAAGPVVGRMALRFMIEADSAEDLDRIIPSLPIWPLVETQVTPLLSLADRRNSVQSLLDRLVSGQ